MKEEMILAKKKKKAEKDVKIITVDQKWYKSVNIVINEILRFFSKDQGNGSIDEDMIRRHVKRAWGTKIDKRPGYSKIEDGLFLVFTGISSSEPMKERNPVILVLYERLLLWALNLRMIAYDVDDSDVIENVAAAPHDSPKVEHVTVNIGWTVDCYPECHQKIHQGFETILNGIDEALSSIDEGCKNNVILEGMANGLCQIAKEFVTSTCEKG
jgi:hypothetical protein